MKGGPKIHADAGDCVQGTASKSAATTPNVSIVALILSNVLSFWSWQRNPQTFFMASKILDIAGLAVEWDDLN